MLLNILTFVPVFNLFKSFNRPAMNKLNVRFGVLTVLILCAALTRLLPHPSNFAPIGAIALFGGAYFKQVRNAIFLPILAFWASDLVLNNIVYKQYYPNFTWFSQNLLWSCLAMVVIALASKILLKKITATNVLAVAFVSATIFFLVSNFGVWASSTHGFTKDFAGLMTCYLAGLPFVLNTLLGDMFFAAILFGVYEWASRKYPKMASSTLVQL